MKEFSLYDYYKLMNEQNVMLAFKGAISSEVLTSLADIVKNKFARFSQSQKIAKKVFSVFIELSQNITHYSSEKVTVGAKEVGSGILTIREEEAFFTVSSGNVATKADVEMVSNKINHLNTLDESELKSLYKVTIRKPRAKGQIGGNVGFIDIRRKSGNLLEHDVFRINEELSFLVIKSKVQKEG